MTARNKYPRNKELKDITWLDLLKMLGLKYNKSKREIQKIYIYTLRNKHIIRRRDVIKNRNYLYYAMDDWLRFTALRDKYLINVGDIRYLWLWDLAHIPRRQIYNSLANGYFGDIYYSWFSPKLLYFSKEWVMNNKQTIINDIYNNANKIDKEIKEHKRIELHFNSLNKIKRRKKMIDTRKETALDLLLEERVMIKLNDKEWGDEEGAKYEAIPIDEVTREWIEDNCFILYTFSPYPQFVFKLVREATGC